MGRSIPRSIRLPFAASQLGELRDLRIDAGTTMVFLYFDRHSSSGRKRKSLGWRDPGGQHTPTGPRPASKASITGFTGSTIGVRMPMRCMIRMTISITPLRFGPGTGPRGFLGRPIRPGTQSPSMAGSRTEQTAAAFIGRSAVGSARHRARLLAASRSPSGTSIRKRRNLARASKRLEQFRWTAAFNDAEGFDESALRGLPSATPSTRARSMGTTAA